MFFSKLLKVLFVLFVFLFGIFFTGCGQGSSTGPSNPSNPPEPPPEPIPEPSATPILDANGKPMYYETEKGWVAVLHMEPGIGTVIPTCYRSGQRTKAIFVVETYVRRGATYNGQPRMNNLAFAHENKERISWRSEYSHLPFDGGFVEGGEPREGQVVKSRAEMVFCPCNPTVENLKMPYLLVDVWGEAPPGTIASIQIVLAYFHINWQIGCSDSRGMPRGCE